MSTIVTYGPGGFDPTKPDNNVIEEIVTKDDPTPVEFTPEVVALVGAIQKATSLADLKARVNASPDLP